MDTDRDASGGGELPAGPGSPTPSPASSPTPEPAADDAARDYGYGQSPLEAAGTGGLPAADSGTEERPQDPDSPATGIHPVTGTRTAPRAVLRPVPEGFPTPPPRPALPNRRPALKQETEPARNSRRGLLIAGISVAVVLLLVVGVGGAVLAVRSLSPADPGASGAPATDGGSSPAAGGTGQVQLGEVTISEVSTEAGVRSVGDQGTTHDPEGEYIVVTFEVTNPSDTAVQIDDEMTLETTDGETHAPDPSAGAAYVGEGEHFGLVPSGGSGVFHKVFDGPIGSEPTALHFDFPALDESGALPLGG